MHTFGETGSGVPAFLAKLWRLVEDPDTNDLIYWSKDGRSFFIQNQAQFARELLPQNYKHNNMASFIRQLNMYGFHKVTSIENGGLKFDRDEMEFSHPCFKRGYPYLLEHIKRKIATAKGATDEKTNYKPEAVNKMLSEVKAMRGRQDSLESRFTAMKQENEALWREIAVLRQKHIKQQQIVNKLIQFLVTIVQPSRNMGGVKRQLMIHDVPQSSRKYSGSDSGPVIHELGLLDEDDSENELGLLGSPNNLNAENEEIHSPMSGSTNIERPQSSASIFSQQQDSNQGDESHLQKRINTSSLDHSEYIADNMYDPVEPTVEIHYPEEIILNTPMVEKVLQRKQEKNRKRKWQGETQNKTISGRKVMKDEKLSKRMLPNDKIQIKNENIDPLLLLDVTNNENLDTMEPTSISAIETTNNNRNQLIANNQQQSSQMYTTKEDFMSTEIPTDLFEDTPMINDTNLANAVYAQSENSPSKSCDQINLEDRMVLSKSPSPGPTAPTEVNKQLTLAKYNNSSKSLPGDDIMKLSTAEDINSHLDNFQGDLDSLRELLRGDGYSLDTSTLTGLFSDSEILWPYGITFSNDGNVNTEDTNKKVEGSELMSYQPQYCIDLSDMIDDSLSENFNTVKEVYNNKQNNNSSTLNTPMHENEEPLFRPK